MPKWGKTDFRQLQSLQKKMQRYSEVDLDAFCKDVARELAARLLRKVIHLTPTGNYKEGRTGGTLKRGWTATGGKEASSGTKLPNAGNYANLLPVAKYGDNYYITVFNPVEYASYVEYGHRTRDHKGWVAGKFMLTKSEIELESQIEGIIKKKMMFFLGRLFE